MPMKNVVLLLMAGMAVSVLTGCGVKKEVHEALVAQYGTATNTITVLEGQKASLEDDLIVEQKKARDLNRQLDDATKTAAELKAKEAQTASALTSEKLKVEGLQGDLAKSKSATEAAQNRGDELQAALIKLQGEYEHLMNRFYQLKKNMMAMGVAPEAVPAEDFQPEEAAPAMDMSEESSSAADLLGEMGDL